MLNDDYKDMLQCLSEENVEFLLVGAYAVAAYGYPEPPVDVEVPGCPPSPARLLAGNSRGDFIEEWACPSLRFRRRSKERRRLDQPSDRAALAIRSEDSRTPASSGILHTGRS